MLLRSVVRFGVLLALLLAAPQAARAAVGTTYALGSEASTEGSWYSPYHALPSLDLRLETMELQLHAMEFLVGLANEQILMGANAHVPVARRPLGAGFEGVIKPGGSLDISTDTDFSPFNITLAGLLAMGAEAQDAMGLGVYVVPALGLGVIYEEIEVVYGGTLQVSVWVN